MYLRMETSYGDTLMAENEKFETESLADVKGAKQYTAFRNPTVRIENNKLVPVIKAPKPPKTEN